MSKVLVTESSLARIAAAIRAKNGSSDTYKPGQMAEAIAEIPTGTTPSGTIDITQNGTADVTNYASANVNVPNSYAAGDEGKVVSNGALVAQTARASEISANGTYDTTLNDEVTVNVSGSSATLITKNITQNGTYNASSDNADGYSQVVVNVSGGGGDSVFGVFDFTKASFTQNNVVFNSNGATFSTTNGIIPIPIAWSDMTIELDVASMSLTSDSHRRFIMATSNSGFIYRNTGVWAFYNGYWENSNITDGNFFDNCTVKVIIDNNNFWHIYKNGVLVWEPRLAQELGNDTSIGASSSSINNAVITKMRIY